MGVNSAFLTTSLPYPPPLAVVLVSGAEPAASFLVLPRPASLEDLFSPKAECVFVFFFIFLEAKFTCAAHHTDM